VVIDHAAMLRVECRSMAMIKKSPPPNNFKPSAVNLPMKNDKSIVPTENRRREAFLAAFGKNDHLGANRIPPGREHELNSSLWIVARHHSGVRLAFVRQRV